MWLNGERKWRVENRNPRTFTNVKVWAAKARHGYPPADANIRNLEYGMLFMYVHPAVCEQRTCLDVYVYMYVWSMVCMYVCMYTGCPKKKMARFMLMPMSAMCISESAATTTTASPQNNVCNVAPQDRRDCGGGGDTIADCLRKGCCHDSSIRGVIWCFYKEGEKFSI